MCHFCYHLNGKSKNFEKNETSKSKTPYCFKKNDNYFWNTWFFSLGFYNFIFSRIYHNLVLYIQFFGLKQFGYISERKLNTAFSSFIYNFKSKISQSHNYDNL